MIQAGEHVMVNKHYQIRKSQDRGFFNHGWLKTYHTFSFADYHDPRFMGHRTLRVINEDTITPGQGFGTHSHKNMEIITVVLEGAVAHKDSLGNQETIQAGEIQVMSAGSGVHHSEFNPLSDKPTHLLQIWILPDKAGVTPRYQQRKLPEQPDEWVLMASKKGEQGSLLIHQDVNLYGLTIKAGSEMQRQLAPNRYGWLQVMEGEVRLGSDTLHPGDGVAIDQGSALQLKAITTAKILFFDLI